MESVIADFGKSRYVGKIAEGCEYFGLWLAGLMNPKREGRKGRRGGII